jgi:glucosamine-6-phosphate deaminase
MYRPSWRSAAVTRCDHAVGSRGEWTDTHYKALQAVTESLKLYEEETGTTKSRSRYRNVWYRFHRGADLFVGLAEHVRPQHTAFMNTFVSQKDALSGYERRTFSELAQRIQVEQIR